LVFVLESAMSHTSTIEERLSHVESDLERLKLQLSQLNSRKKWIDEIRGSFKDDPDFEEILRLGGEIRRSDRLDAQ